jgi:2-polyprenyl-6-methoxyphenol hydroxylase-like FAD-dependent oxidoreductase
MSVMYVDRPSLLGQHALVIGASMAGLVAARVLSERFAHVTIVERDTLPPIGVNRRGVPQGWHGHGLLASGLGQLVRLFPTLLADLTEAGAIEGDVVGRVRWFQHGRYKAKFRSGLNGLLLSRALLEGMVRRHVRALPNVGLVDGTHVAGLIVDAAQKRVTGVRVRGVAANAEPAGPEIQLTTDLVVDASGRSSRMPVWLDQLGYAKPRVDEVKVGLGYTTRTFVRHERDLDGDLGAIIAPTPPRETRAGFILAMEGGRWVVSLCGWMGDHAQPTDEGFLAFAQSLPRPEIHEVIRRAMPLTGPTAFAFPANVRRRYEALARFPQRLLVMGDAIASFNPIYGQGMSVAALEGAELEACLDDVEGLHEIGRRFFTRAARVIDTPWTMAVGSDFAFTGVTGPRPAATSLVNWYLDHVHDAASIDRRVCRRFFDVANMLAPPTALFRPGVVARVALARLGSTLQTSGRDAAARRDDGQDDAVAARRVELHEVGSKTTERSLTASH